MTVFFINNDGGGFAANIDVADGTTIGQLFDQRMPGRKSEDYLIRVDRQVVPADHVLTPGSRVTITPTKIAGARRVVWRMRKRFHESRSRVALCKFLNQTESC